MLDDHDRMSPRNVADQFGGGEGFGVGHAGDRLVDQQQLRVVRQQHADLEPLLLAVRKGAGDPGAMVLETRSDEDQVDGCPDIRLLTGEEGRIDAARRFGREQKIVLDRVRLEHRRLLELAADAERGDLGLVELGGLFVLRLPD